MTTSLNGRQRRHLRALAHDRKPVVQVGHGGLTEPVVSAIDQALETHELIKIKVSADAPEDAGQLVARIEELTRSTVAQVIGHTLVIYRRRKEKPVIELPKATSRRRSNQGGDGT